MGNVKSVMNMLKKIGIKSTLSRNMDDIIKAEKLILPGVGAFDAAMQKLKEYNLIDILNTKVIKEKTPVLGICLGMHIMSETSEEGNLSGLGWFNAQVKKFNFDSSPNHNLPIPHMGWNVATPNSTENLFKELDAKSRFYFVHSYHIECRDKNDILATTNYGYEFTCSVHKDNIYAVQFHPEKSHKFGMQLLKNFVNL